MEKTEKENQTLVRCSDCRVECTGKSIKATIENFICGRDGGPLRESCKATLRSNGQNLFKVIPVELKSKKKDNDKKSNVDKE